MEIKSRYDSELSGMKRLSLMENGEEQGFLLYLPKKLFQPNVLQFLYSNKQIPGISKLLIQSLRSEVGHGPLITSEIIHNKSWIAMEKLGILRTAFDSNKEIIIKNQSLLSSIPITNILQNGGIIIDALSIKHIKKIESTYNDILISVKSEIPSSAGNFFFTKINGRT